MRVAFVAPDALTVLLFFRGLIHQLRAGGADIVVFSAEEGRGAELRALGVTSIDVPLDRFLNPWADARYCLQLARLFRRERCETAFLCCTKPNVYGAPAARMAGVRRVFLHVQGLGAAFVPGGGLRHRMIRGTLAVLYRAAAKVSTKIWFVNPGDAAYFRERGLARAEQVVLTRNYLDTDEYAPAARADGRDDPLRRELGLESDHFVVLMVARMLWSKGVGEFVEAAALLRDRYPLVRFLLVGPTEPRNLDAVPESIVHGWRNVTNLSWLGFRADIKDIYRLCDVAVLPSYYKEGMPRGLLEPMAMGKAIITSDSKDCRDAIEHGRNGYVVPARNAAALAAAVARLADDPAACARFGAYGRMKAEREFSEADIVPRALHALGLATSVAR